jgi:4-amino-4-deoxy-L-arabinose transferase-like glycosyltransferase
VTSTFGVAGRSRSDQDDASVSRETQVSRSTHSTKRRSRRPAAAAALRHDAAEKRPAAPRTSDRPEQQCQQLLLLGLLAGAVVLRLPYLSQSLWYDEVFYTAAALNGESLRWVLTQDVHPPLYASVLWLWIHVFGDTEVAVRLPSVLCGIASVAVVFALGRWWFDTRAAFLAAGLTALSPAHIWYSQENKTNMLMVLLTACLVWAADRAWSSNHRREWIWVAVTAVLAPWTNVFAIFVLAAVLLWLWSGALQRRWRSRLRPVIIVTGVAACPFVPLLFSTLGHFESMRLSYLRPFTLPEVYKLLLIYLSHGNTLRTISPYAPLNALLLQPWPFFLVDGFFGLLLLIGLWRLITRVRARDASGLGDWSRVLPILYFTVPLVCVFIASRFNPQVYIERSMLILLPPYLILIAVGACAWRGPLLRHLMMAALLVLNGCALFNLWVAKVDVWTVYKPKNDWRSAAQYFAAEMREAKGPLVLLASVPVSVLVYYDHHIAEVAGPEAALPEQAGALIFYLFQSDKAPLLETLRRAKAGTFYIVEDTYWAGSTKQLLARVNADADFEPLAARSFKGVRISKFKWKLGQPQTAPIPDTPTPPRTAAGT